MAVCQKFFETFRTLLFIKISPDSACDGAFGGFQQRELTISLINNQLIVYMNGLMIQRIKFLQIHLLISMLMVINNYTL